MATRSFALAVAPPLSLFPLSRTAPIGNDTTYLKDEKVSIDDIKLTPLELSELIASIKNGTISAKIGKEILA
ncbi:unnamed protein product [Miscanthus lutarioriparius]|uniref:Asn/Gln amidotransferase domain-containing protein n=1 Tax=Miscanthus lutarioriparius TaxID=422564 RepID=A0A811N2X5_9POAL|nr:unnamed protein product [Miscanthus lutarioriparius]